MESYWQYQQSLRSLSDVSSYGNPGISSGVGDCEGVGVIGFSVSVGAGVVGVVGTFFIVFGIPHIFDSVVLTNLSFGLLGSHTFDFIAGEIVVLAGDGEVGDGVTWA